MQVQGTQRCYPRMVCGVVISTQFLDNEVKYISNELSFSKCMSLRRSTNGRIRRWAVPIGVLTLYIQPDVPGNIESI